MGKMKAEAMGDTAPPRAAYLEVGRFRLTSSPTCAGRLGMFDRVTGEAGIFDEVKLEAALLNFFTEEF